jgi:perosamine synthetase
VIGKPLGKMACFSFHPRKILTTGEGGMITTGDAEMADRLRKLRQHAMSLSDVTRHRAKHVTTETYDEVGYNFRMTDMQAAVGITQLNRLESLLERRRLLASRYDDALKSIPWVETPYVPVNCTHNYQSYMIRLIGEIAGKRDSVMQELLEKNISTRRAIMAIHRERPYLSTRWEVSLPQTNRVTDTCMILPLFHDLSEADQDYVIDALYAVKSS